MRGEFGPPSFAPDHPMRSDITSASIEAPARGARSARWIMAGRPEGFKGCTKKRAPDRSWRNRHSAPLGTQKI